MMRAAAWTTAPTPTPAAGVRPFARARKTTTRALPLIQAAHRQHHRRRRPPPPLSDEPRARRRRASATTRAVTTREDEAATATADDDDGGDAADAASSSPVERDENDIECIAWGAGAYDPGLDESLLSESRCDLTTAVKFRRDAEWREYQSPSRYFQQLTTINGSVVARRVAAPAIAVAAWAAAVAFAVKSGLAWTAGMTAAAATATPFLSVVGGAVSLLIGFRTNAAYGRFCDAADSFADVLGSVRNLSRKLAVWCPEADRARMAALVAALPWAVKARGQGVEGSADATMRLRRILTPTGQFESIEPTGNVPAQARSPYTGSHTTASAW
eukprot:30984-Pelagococcus_subviridis.AAC.9